MIEIGPNLVEAVRYAAAAVIFVALFWSLAKVSL